MDVKDAVAKAKSYVADQFGDERIADVTLEEIEYDDAKPEWRITVGFARPRPQLNPIFRAKDSAPVYRQEYKIVGIDDATGAVRYLKNREGVM